MLDLFKNKTVFNQLNFLSLSVRLSFVTAMIALLWFASAQPVLDSSTDDEFRARISEIQSASADAEAPFDDDIQPLALFGSTSQPLPVILVTLVLTYSVFAPRRTTFYHIPPRSPPVL